MLHQPLNTKDNEKITNQWYQNAKLCYLLNIHYKPIISPYWDLTIFLKTMGWVKCYLNPVALKN